ncbi:MULTISPECIES: septation ring formation regulator EzrA [unclassified Granulicatella]|uniref:septation ring formation regulator EzrA n=1 Tax=unclassified Granulicatella TaxID=2630493 RepID=UPI001073844B|nr:MULTISPECIES: septation ring formation regulator EzrA [unclassified Granulicatella]MBF0780578.1 selenide, water dikinase [Granulicatella sp. 19428wC4_WM01]TFU94888.1 selenide, water dikinase [Granulicatella sp. WM01]
MTYIFMGVVIIGLVAYGAALYYRGKQTQAIVEIDEKKVAVFDIPVDSVIFKLKNMHLSGQTKRLYESWAYRWDELVKEQLPNIESQLDLAEQHIGQLHLLKSKQMLDEARRLVDEAEKTAFQIDEALQRIVDSETSNHEEIEGISKKYQQLRNKILADSLIYQEAFSTIESRLTGIEDLLEQFNQLMEEADYLEAREVLKDVEHATDKLEEKLADIPHLYTILDEEYQEQVKDLQDGYARLIQESYKFEQDTIEQDIEQVEANIASAKKDVTSLELEDAREKNEQISKQIDRLYDIMEAEVEAKEFIQNAQLGLEGRLKHVLANNRLVMHEIDRVMQSFELSDQEVERVSQFKEELEKEDEALTHYRAQLAEHQVVYTTVKTYFEELSEKLVQIDKEQAEIMKSVSGLSQREREVRDQLDMFEVDLRNMKRALEKQHLPGLDKVYLDLFFATTKRIETLSEKLDRIRINMKEIDEFVAMCTEDVERLDEETENIIDSALLTEQFIQYANRYRMEHASVEKAINVAINLYTHQFKYDQARDTIASALNQVERGATQRVERLYFEEKNKRSF